MPSTLQRLPAPPDRGKDSGQAAGLHTLIDELIAEQSRLQTPVARFSEIHERQPDLADHYRSLIPLSRPGAGEQYAFEVSLDRCTGCKACVSACHSLNGLDEHEAWRDTGTLLGGEAIPGWQQTVTTACHHCEDPGCLNGCPVAAYEKDADTGIVRHLDDQCIGCSYCILKCPYDVPKYSVARGIVRKCDMCHQRLAEGEAPACVQACPTEAIRIVTVARSESTAGSRSQVSWMFSEGRYQQSSSIPSSRITLPTTRYVGRPLPISAHAADRDALSPQPAHWPLVLMLILTQSGIGILAGVGTQADGMPLLLVGILMFFMGMAAAVLHLGQPLKAWRFFLGLKTSWLSREILAFGLFAPIPILLAALPLLPEFAWKSSLTLLARHSMLPLGLLAVFTSVMIYHDTQRSLWRFSRTALRFFGTVAAFGILAMKLQDPMSMPLSLAFTLVVLIKWISEMRLIRLHKLSRWTPDRHSARLQRGPLWRVFLARSVSAGLAIAFIHPLPWLSFTLLLLAELFERQLFFQSVHAPKMPGHFGPPRQSPC